MAVVIILAPEPGAATWVLLSDPDHVGTGVPLLLFLLVLDRGRAARWVPAAVFVILTWASIGDPLVEVVGALPAASVAGTPEFSRSGTAACHTVVRALGRVCVVYSRGRRGA